MADNLAYQEPPREKMINGKIVMMSPRPAWNHNTAASNIHTIFNICLKGKKCVPVAGGTDLFLTETDRFIPDFMIVCDPDKLDKYGCRGAPDLVIEILSPSTRRHDRFVKLMLYQRAGVREYWIVDPEEKSVQVFLLKDGFLHPYAYYNSTEIAKVNVLEYCYIDLKEIFED